MGGAVSSGENNDDLVDKLVDRECIVSREVERLFRAVDRGHFMTSTCGEAAYQDTAWRESRLHLSAPCIYTAVLESLALRPGHRFLNIGSGTGYISTLAGLAVGSGGINHGVELFADVVEYARQRVDEFIRHSPSVDQFDFGQPLFISGNALRLEALNSLTDDEDSDECTNQKYDRVYCGAGCDIQQMELLRQLLVVGGVLVAPVNDSLVRVERLSKHRWRCEEKLSVSFAPLRTSVDADGSGDEDEIVGSTQPTCDSAESLRLPVFAPASLLQLCRSAVRSALRSCVVANMGDYDCKEWERGVDKVRRKRQRKKHLANARNRRMMRILYTQEADAATSNLERRYLHWLIQEAVVANNQVPFEDDDATFDTDGVSDQRSADGSNAELSENDAADERDVNTVPSDQDRHLSRQRQSRRIGTASVDFSGAGVSSHSHQIGSDVVAEVGDGAASSSAHEIGSDAVAAVSDGAVSSPSHEIGSDVVAEVCEGDVATRTNEIGPDPVAVVGDGDVATPTDEIGPDVVAAIGDGDVATPTNEIGSDVTSAVGDYHASSSFDDNESDVAAAVGDSAVATAGDSRLGVKRSADGVTLSPSPSSAGAVPSRGDHLIQSPAANADQHVCTNTTRDESTPGSRDSQRRRRFRCNRIASASSDSDCSVSNDCRTAEKKQLVPESRDTVLGREISRRMCAHVAILPLPLRLREYVNLDRPLVGV